MADIPIMDPQMHELTKAWADWKLKIENRAKEIEKKRDLEVKAALDFTLIPQATMANNFPSFLDTSPSTSIPRHAPVPVPQQQQQQANNNGNGAGMNGMPMPAGQQADVNFLFQKLVELSEVLKENREKTAGIIAGAEELAVSTFTRAFKTFCSCLNMLFC